ncbi:hypothetical protein [Methylobacterium sp. MA0201]|uniref:hypothetical protein n=1 Tax=Methylobacterium alsaeris TaxID=3344826 RepID=UPI00375661D9
MASRVLRLYTDDELVAKARHLRDQIDAGLTMVSDGLGASANVVGAAAARRIVNELMDELDRRQGLPPQQRVRVTLIVPDGGYGSGRPNGMSLKDYLA